MCIVIQFKKKKKSGVAECTINNSGRGSEKNWTLCISTRCQVCIGEGLLTYVASFFTSDFFYE